MSQTWVDLHRTQVASNTFPGGSVLGEVGVLMEAKDPGRRHQGQVADVLQVILA